MPHGTSNEVFFRKKLSVLRREAFRIHADGFVFKGRESHRWQEVWGIRTYPNFLGDLILKSLWSPNLRLSIYLIDGRVLKLRDRVFSGATASSSRGQDRLPAPYWQLVGLLRDRLSRDWQGPREEHILIGITLSLAAVAFFVSFVLLGAVWSGLQTDERKGLAVAIAVVAGNAGGLLLQGPVGRALRLAYIRCGESGGSGPKDTESGGSGPKDKG